MNLNFFNYLNIIFFLLLLFLTQNSYAQLSGTYTIPGTPFTTIKKAVDSLNIVGVGIGGVTFNVTSGYVENTTTPVTLTATGTSTKNIIIQKTGGGVNPIITRTDAGSLSTSVRGGAGDAVVRIEGSDYITFNGINVTANDQGIEYGYLTHKPSGTDGCQNVTITNCTISMNKGTSSYVAGIYLGNGTTSVSSSTGVTVTNSNGINSVIVLTGNTIQNVHNGILSIGSVASGFFDNNITIGQAGSGNILQNFGGGVADTCYGIYFRYVNNPSISYNTIDNTAGGGVAHTYNQFQIFFSIVSGDIVANNNILSINNSSTRTSSFIHNNNNTVNSETYNNNIFSGTLNTGTLNLIYTFSNNTPNKTVSGNAITGITKSGGAFNGYYAAGLPVGGTETITNNNFSNLNFTSGSGTVYMVYCSSSITHNIVLSNNIFSNIIYSGSATIYAINATGVNNNQINNNTISNITTGASLYGINFSGLNASVFNNSIYGLTSTTTGSNVVYGISTSSITNNTTNLNIYNNFISDIKAPGSTSFSGTSGISAISGTNVNIYYNTVFLKFTSTNASNKSAALALGDTSPDQVDIRDNIFVNLADVTNGQFACVIRKTSDWLLNFAASCNNNLYYAGTPSSKHLIFYDGTNADSTLIQYKNRVSPRELNSVTENPSFVNSITPPYDLHINTTIPTQVESGGTPITSPIVITTDYDGNTRNATTPDIGADEFVGIPADLASPIIVYNPLLNTSSTSARTLVVSVTDPGSGVPTTAPGWPNLYWKKKFNGVWTAVTPVSVVGSVYTYNFGSGVTLNDTVFYYIVAQDLATPPNIGAYPSIGAGGFTSNPPAASIPPTTPSSYIITNAALAGNYSVGTGGNYQTITAAITDLNLRGVSSTVNFLLIDDAYSISETFPLEISIVNVSKPTTTNTVTIKPNTGVVALIQGATAYSPLFKILESYVRIDGSNSGGTDRSLTIQNTINDHPYGILFGSKGTTPITGGSLKNCNIISGAAYSTPNYGIIISDGEFPGIEGYFNNITIQNNKLQKSFYGIYCIASVSTGNGNGLLITGNNLNATSTNAIHERGIYLEGVDGALVSNNSVGNLGGNDAGSPTGIWFGPGTINSSMSNNIIGPMTESTGGGTPRGIAVSSGISNSNITIAGNELFNFSTSYGGALTAMYIYSTTTGVTIENNKVSDIVNTNDFGFGARGIIINTNIANSDITIKNNFVWNVRATAKSFPGSWGVGIGIDGSTGGVNVYHNSVNLYGTLATDSAGVNTAFGVLDANVSSLDVRDNIFVNKFSNTLSSFDKSYAINSQAPSTAFTNINFNDYYVEGPVGILGYLGGERTTLVSWQTATGQDANSISGNPDFLNDIDLHINPNSSFVSNKGFYFGSVPTDIDGDTRNNPPDIGGDEYILTATTFALSMTVANGWNMVSVPGLHPTDQNVNTWWQYRDMGANVFKYLGGYQSVTTVTPGIGYWMKHSGARTYNTGDEWPGGGIQIVAHSPLAGAIGWNLIGGYEISATAALVTTIPSGQQSGPIYKYSGGYQVATTIDPGYGYWIKLLSAAQIIIPETFAKESKPVEYFPENWGKIVITDATGINYTLYAIKGQVDLSQYELPPAPMEGMFDIRFSSGRIAEDINSSMKTIDMSGVTYPITVRSEGMDMRMMDETGKTVNVNLKSGEEVVISDATIEKLMVTSELIPAVYALEQNYPNPFNPSTVIEFSLPEDVSNVKLSIYNALGEKVAELVNTALAAGKYSYQWNAKNVATGLYIYELRADKFVSVKKMLLLK
jgi:trimeric autotransporter adhesin